MNCATCPVFAECKADKTWLSREVAEPKRKLDCALAVLIAKHTVKAKKGVV